MLRLTSNNQVCMRVFLALALTVASSASTARSALVSWGLNPLNNQPIENKAFVELRSLLTRSMNDSPITEPLNQVGFQTGANEKGTGMVTAEANRSTKRQFATNDENQLGVSFSRSTDVHRESNLTGQPHDLQLFTVSSTPLRPNTELDEAMARSAFNEEFVSVPTVRLTSIVTGSTALSVISTANVGVVPVPELSAFFPVIGLIVAVFCTQILRRRRAAQQAGLRRLV